MHSIFALLQLAHGCFLSHRTLRFRQVVHDRGFKEVPGLPFEGVDAILSPLAGEVPFGADMLG